MKYLFLLFLALLLNIGELLAHVELDYPEGGEIFQQGESITIQWHLVIEHPQNNWDLFISYDGGLTWSDLALDVPVIQTEYRWIVPNVFSEMVKIKIVQDNSGGGNYESASDNFTITDEITSVQYPTDQNRQKIEIYKIPHKTALLLRYGVQKETHVTLSVFNLTGRLVFIQEILLYQGETNEIRIKHPPMKQGMYLYQINMGGEIHAGKIFFE